LDLLCTQNDAVGGGVLLDAGDSLGAGDLGDVIALCEQPGQSDLCRGCTRLCGNGNSPTTLAQESNPRFTGENFEVANLRLPLGILCIIAGFFWFLPVVGLELFPIGLLTTHSRHRRPPPGLSIRISRALSRSADL
jgi:hypothetical protein